MYMLECVYVCLCVCTGQVEVLPEVPKVLYANIPTDLVM